MMNILNEKGDSPFTPGSPVPLELFVGRTEQINEILRYIQQVTSGRQENVFLIGERGIGKSSLAAFINSLAKSKYNALAVHVFLGRVTDLESMVHHIFEQILKETKKETWFNEVAGFFGKYIKEVDLFGLSVTFNPPPDDLSELVRNFPDALYNLMTKIQQKKKALFLALDDINGLAEKPQFADWYKSFVDEVATKYRNLPVFIMLIGLPEKRDLLYKNQPSLMRIFRIVEIDKLSDEEVKNFFHKAFELQAGMKVERNAMEILVRYSSGLPLLMQEIGDATFWTDQDGIIDEKDAKAGILDAAVKIGKKYLDPKVFRVIRSLRYRSILRKLGKNLSRNFHKKEIESRLNNEEKRVFHNFLKRMRELGIIEPDLEHGRGSYRFVNELYPIYFWIESKFSSEK